MCPALSHEIGHRERFASLLHVGIAHARVTPRNRGGQQALDMRDRRTAVDPVPQIEDMRPVGESFEDEPIRTRIAGRFRPAATGSRLPWTGIPAGNSRAAHADRWFHPHRLPAPRFPAHRPAASPRPPSESRSPAYRDVAREAPRRSALGPITSRSNSSGARLPDQLSNSWTASAPAAIWPRKIVDRLARRSHREWHRAWPGRR